MYVYVYVYVYVYIYMYMYMYNVYVYMLNNNIIIAFIIVFTEPVNNLKAHVCAKYNLVQNRKLNDKAFTEA